MRILLFGSRDFSDQRIVELVVRGLFSDDVVIHGKAPGADRLADVYARKWGHEIEPYPADWDRYGRSAGPIRNQQMLDEGEPDMAIGFTNKPLVESIGSADMAARCLHSNLPLYVVEAFPCT